MMEAKEPGSLSATALRDQQQAAGAVFGQQDGRDVALHYGDSAAEYTTALQGVALYECSGTGRLWLRDRDRAELLHRLSTNDVKHLQPGEGTRTVLANHNGRIIDLLTVYALAEELLVVTSTGQGAAVGGLLRKNIFFNDRLQVVDASAALIQLMLYGPGSASLLDELTGAAVSGLALHGIVTGQVGDGRIWIARALPIGGDGFALYIPNEAAALVWAALVQAGAQPLGQAAYDILRVEAGYPAFGRELGLDYIPLETGLWDAVSFTKGCYVGQEIIGRMERHNRLAKQLRGLRLTGPVTAPGKLLATGAESAAHRDAGDLTSVVQSPRFGAIGLAYVRTAYAEPGTTVDIAESDATGTVVALPFDSAENQ